MNYNSGHDILRLFLIFYQILFWSQVKWSVIISNKYGIYEGQISHWKSFKFGLGRFLERWSN